MRGGNPKIRMARGAPRSILMHDPPSVGVQIRINDNTPQNLNQGSVMPTCEVCGNDYDKCFEVRRNHVTHVFDCFECAIHALSPVCQHCGVRVVGHGVEVTGLIFCCASCATRHGVHGFTDRIGDVVARA